MNRDIFKLKAPVNEESIQFTSKSKTEFAFDLICNNSNYKIPKYIKDGCANCSLTKHSRNGNKLAERGKLA